VTFLPPGRMAVAWTLLSGAHCVVRVDEPDLALVAVRLLLPSAPDELALDLTPADAYALAGVLSAAAEVAGTR
jgi:hypothetical protein